MKRDQCIEALVLRQLQGAFEQHRATAEQLVTVCLDHGLLYHEDQIMRALQRLRRKGAVAVSRSRPISIWEARSG